MTFGKRKHCFCTTFLKTAFEMELFNDVSNEVVSCCWHCPRDELQMEMKLLHCSKNNWEANKSRFLVIYCTQMVYKHTADYIYSFIYICLIANKISGNGIYPVNDIIAIRKSKKVEYISIWFILTAIIDCTLLCFMIMELLHFLRAAAQMQDQSVYFSFFINEKKKNCFFLYILPQT